MSAARVPVFLLDEHQVVRPGEIGTVSYITEAAERLAEKLTRHAPRFADLPVKRSWACLRTFAPDRKPQERVYSVFSFLFEHGWGLVDRLGAALDSESFTMNEIEL